MKKILSIILCIGVVLTMSSCDFLKPKPSIEEILGRVPEIETVPPTIKPVDKSALETTQKTPEPTPTIPGAVELKLNQTVTVGDAMEVTIESSEWAEKILPPNTSGVYSYIDDKENEKYFVVKGKVKNLGGENLEISFRGMKASLVINDKYKADVEINEVHPDGTGFYGEIKPLQTMNIILYASITDELYDICKNIDMTLKVVNDENYISTYFREDEVPFNTYIIKFVN